MEITIATVVIQKWDVPCHLIKIISHVLHRFFYSHRETLSNIIGSDFSFSSNVLPNTGKMKVFVDCLLKYQIIGEFFLCHPNLRHH